MTWHLPARFVCVHCEREQHPTEADVVNELPELHAVVVTCPLCGRTTSIMMERCGDSSSPPARLSEGANAGAAGSRQRSLPPAAPALYRVHFVEGNTVHACADCDITTAKTHLRYSLKPGAKMVIERLS